MTTAPRRTIGAESPWRAADGSLRHATVFDVVDEAPAGRVYRDSAGAVENPVRHVVPVATIIDGVWRDCVTR